MSARRWKLTAGAILLLAGALGLGYVGWQIYGTTWVAKREQHRVVDATERVWAQERAGETVSQKDHALADGVVALIRIPAFGRDFVVPAHEGTSDDVLARGFGVFETDPEPGGIGNFAIAGHRITHGEPLRDMPDLEPGDTVEVETADTVYEYTLDTAGDALTVGMNETWAVQADPKDPANDRDIADEIDSRRLLTLITCSELFHTDNRLVAFAHLTGQRRIS